MGRVKFRDALPSDLEALEANNRITHHEHAARVPRVFRPDAEPATAQLIREHFNPGSGNSAYWTRIVVCTIDEVFAGHVLFVFWREPFGPEQHDVCAEIAEISIVPDQRGNGIGKQLLARAQIEMKASGATIAQAKIWRGNPVSAALFEDGGYAAVSQWVELRLREPQDYPMPQPAKVQPTPEPPAGLTQEAYTWFLIIAAIGLIIWSSR